MLSLLIRMYGRKTKRRLQGQRLSTVLMISEVRANLQTKIFSKIQMKGVGVTLKNGNHNGPVTYQALKMIFLFFINSNHNNGTATMLKCTRYRRRRLIYNLTIDKSFAFRRFVLNSLV